MIKIYIPIVLKEYTTMIVLQLHLVTLKDSLNCNAIATLVKLRTVTIVTISVSLQRIQLNNLLS